MNILALGKNFLKISLSIGFTNLISIKVRSKFSETSIASWSNDPKFKKITSLEPSLSKFALPISRLGKSELTSILGPEPRGYLTVAGPL